MKTYIYMLSTVVALSMAGSASAAPVFTANGPGSSSATYINDNTVDLAFADNNGANAYNGRDNWTFSATADSTGAYEFSYSANGYSAFYQASAYANAFSGSDSQTLYSMGTFDSYARSGTFTLNLVKGQTFGINAGGRNFDSDARIQGRIQLTSNAFTAAVPEPATWAMMLVGFGMVAGAARYRRRSANVSFA